MDRSPTRSIGGLAAALTGLLAGHVAVELVFVSIWVSWLRLLADAAGGGYVSGLEAQALLDRERLLDGVSLSLLLVTGVVWLIWEYRAQANLLERGTRSEFTPVWAVGWWFVPVANLVQPFRVMRGLWRGSAPAASPPASSRTSSAIVGWWWALWLAGSVVSIAVSGGAASASTIPQARRVMWGATASSLLTLGAAIMALILVRGLTARLSLAGGAMPVPPPPGAGTSAWGDAPTRPDVP
jgi:hypothetical protein